MHVSQLGYKQDVLHSLHMVRMHKKGWMPAGYINRNSSR